MKNFLFALACLALFSCNSQKYVELEVVENPSIVPQPQSMKVDSGANVLIPGLSIIADSPEANKAAETLQTMLAAIGWESNITANRSNGNFIKLVHQTDADSNPESYTLTVAAGVEITAPGEQGLFYGIQSLLQLLPQDGKGAQLPNITIEDSPRFPYRGMHLDVCRHFFPVEFIKKYLDLMAFYKMNTFHWHLTEDQGWRIEIKKYPKLVEVGSKRKETILEKNFDPYVGDGIPHEGYYTQEQIKEIVAYAAERQITVIPEIEMPGHSMAALAAYPALGCTPGPFEVGTKWGVYEDIYCPSEETFEFLENVLTEVIDLFPSEYIHIGGDEAPKKAWKESALAQEVIRRQGLKDEFELQSYFIKRIEKFLLSKGRKLIGWDEILEGGLAPEATVMSWRGEKGGIEAAKEGHDVIMTPNDICYLDHYQGDSETEPLAIGGFTSMEDIYTYEPVPAELSEEKAHHVLGAQGNVWTEYMKTSDHVEYMVFPRMLALSETVWTKKENKDWQNFQNKLPAQYKLLESKGVNYRKPN